jgi:allophanate hydrolase subunit 1
MTKVEVRYELTAAMTDDLMEAIDRTRGVYGLAMIRLSPSMGELIVHYDASRLSLPDVDKSLRRAGLPVRRREE